MENDYANCRQTENFVREAKVLVGKVDWHNFEMVAVAFSTRMSCVVVFVRSIPIVCKIETNSNKIWLLSSQNLTKFYGVIIPL